MPMLWYSLGFLVIHLHGTYHNLQAWGKWHLEDLRFIIIIKFKILQVINRPAIVRELVISRKSQWKNAGGVKYKSWASTIIRDNIEFLPLAVFKVNLLNRYICHARFIKLSLSWTTNVKAGSWNQHFQLHGFIWLCKAVQVVQTTSCKG